MTAQAALVFRGEDGNGPVVREAAVLLDLGEETVGVPVLYAFSCSDLVFSCNRIFKSPSAPQEAEKKAPIRLSYCQKVSLSNNQWIGNFDSTGYEAEHCQDATGDM